MLQCWLFPEFRQSWPLFCLYLVRSQYPLLPISSSVVNVIDVGLDLDHINVVLAV